MAMFWKRIAFPVNPDFPAGIPPRPPGTAPSPQVVPSGDELKGRPLGRVLVKMGKATREQVVEALIFQKKHGGLVGEVMVKLGFVQPADVDAALAGQRRERL